MTDLPAIRQLGICCIIEDHRRGLVTPDPKDELGARISMLLDELRRDDNGWRFVLWTTKSGRPKYEAAFGATDVAIWPPPPPKPRPPLWAALLLRDSFRGEWVGRAPEVLFSPTGRAVSVLKSLGSRFLAGLDKGPHRLLKPLTYPALGVLLWCAFAATMLGYAASAAVCLPYRGLCRRLKHFALRRMMARPDIFPPTEPEIGDPPPGDAVRLWLAPSPLCVLPTSLPFVLLVDDVPIYAAPDRFAAGFVATMNAHLRTKAPQALLIASPHRGVLDHVLRDFLGCAVQKMRLCPPLAQGDSEIGADPQSVLAGKRYLVCPSANRPEKNLPTLVKAFAILRQWPDQRDLHLALTGVDGPLERHPELLATILVHGLDPFVHLLGPLAPAYADATTCNAEAAVFPSLHEPSAEAVFRALGRRCPVACAAIPELDAVSDCLGDACVSFRPHDPQAIAESLQNLLADRTTMAARQLERFASFIQHAPPPSTWHEILDEADLIRQQGPQRLYPVDDDEPYRLALVLQQPIPGGTWESAREIVEGLARVNQQRRRFELQFIPHPGQPNVDQLRIDARDIACVPRALVPLPADELRRLFRQNLSSAHPEANEERLAFFAELDREALLDQDALFFLAGSFPAWLAAVRPYGVMVLDMVPFQLADQFPENGRSQCKMVLRPTYKVADLLVATSEATRRLVLEHCDIDADRAVLVPLGCETFRRLADAIPDPVAGLDRPFVLNITNYSPHKGAATVIEAYIELKRRLGDACPTLVFAGCRTDAFLPSSSPPSTDYVAAIRARIAAANLTAGRDIMCLGMISDSQAAWLYRNGRAVVNAAQADNGTYCLIEGHYFGRPVVTSDYPAARWLCERFGLPVHYFRVGDAAALCNQLQAALGEPILAGEQLALERRRLEADEFSRERFALRLYEHLLKLAATGREQRRRAAMKLSATQQRAVVRMVRTETASCS